MKTIDIRRSVRTYTDKPVEKEKLEALVRAAMQAPSACNRKPWEFVIVTDTKKLHDLAAISPYWSALKRSKAAILVLSRNSGLIFPEYWQQDLGAASQNILLEAVEQGLGGVWLGVAPHPELMEPVETLVHAPDHLSAFCLISVGYPANDDAHTFIDRYEESRVHYESCQY